MMLCRQNKQKCPHGTHPFSIGRRRFIYMQGIVFKVKILNNAYKEFYKTRQVNSIITPFPSDLIDTSFSCRLVSMQNLQKIKKKMTSFRSINKYLRIYPV